MPDEEPFTITGAAKISVGDVRARACPVGARATWVQLIVAFASIALFAALFVGAVTRDPVSLPGAGLSLVGFVVAAWVFVGVLKTRFGRGS